MLAWPDFIVAERATNVATEDQYVAIIHAHLSRGLGSTYSTPDYKVVCIDYEALLEDLVFVAVRPSESMLTECLKAYFSDKYSFGELQMFAERMVGALSHCRKIAYTAHSGAKLQHGVQTIVAAIAKTQDKKIGHNLALSEAKIKGYRGLAGIVRAGSNSASSVASVLPMKTGKASEEPIRSAE